MYDEDNSPVYYDSAQVMRCVKPSTEKRYRRLAFTERQERDVRIKSVLIKLYAKRLEEYESIEKSIFE